MNYLSSIRKTKGMELPLFWKFSIAISATVLLFGTLNLLYIRNQVYQTFEEQIEKHGISIAMGIAEASAEPILYDDLVALDNLISQAVRVNNDIGYILILNSDGELLAHSFRDHMPRELSDINKPGSGGEPGIVIIRDTRDKRSTVRDIALPILESYGGTVRVGMREAEFYARISRITTLFLGMVFFFLFLGIGAALVLSYVITDPLKAISSYASGVGLSSFDHTRAHYISLDDRISVRLKNLFGLTDEIDILDKTFNEMLLRLNTAYFELMRANESLSHSEKMASVGTLAAGLAHEINNPLAGMRNCIRRISEKPENVSQNAEYIKLMSDALEKMEHVVEGMLNFSRKQDLVFSETDIKDLVANSLALVRYQIDKSEIALAGNYADQNFLVSASPNHLEQVFLNIVLNSIDAINERKSKEPAHVGRISINLRSENNSVIVVFTDNGTGVPQDKLASIFDPFFTLKKIKQGTGLGLSVSYNIITSHNGNITAYNEEGGGLTTIVTIPFSL